MRALSEALSRVWQRLRRPAGALAPVDVPPSPHQGPYRDPAERTGPERCLAVVANVRREGGGTRHFAPGAKLTLRRLYNGAGTVEVVGRHLRSKRYIRIVMDSHRLVNARVMAVHSPRVRKLLDGRAPHTCERDYVDSVAALFRERSEQQTD